MLQVASLMIDDGCSDHELLIKLKQSRMEASGILYARYAVRFYQYARHKGLSDDDATDVVQETFVGILRGVHGYREEAASGAGWMWTICHNALIDLTRKRKRTIPIPENPDDLMIEAPDQLASVENTEITMALSAAHKALTPEERADLRRGPGRGPGRKAWHAAARRVRALYHQFYREFDA